MSIFNPADFMNQSFEGANSTKRELHPVGEFQAVIEKIEARPWQSKNDPTKSGVTLEVYWSMQDASALASIDMEKLTLRQGVMLDFNETGGLDMGKGKNVGLGRLRAAVGLNEPGVAFQFPQLIGRMAKVSVRHEVDKEDPEKIYDRVTAATALS